MTKKTTQPKNEIMKAELFNLFTGIKDGSVDKTDATIMIKAANSICNVVKTEIAVNKFNLENGIGTRGRKKKLTL